MDREQFLDALAQQPVIAAVKSGRELPLAMESSARAVFLLYGDIVCAPAIVDRLTSAGKIVLVHVDLMEGLASREIAVDYIARSTSAQGILSTKPALVRRARECGMLAVQRFFLLDSLALENVTRQLAHDSGGIAEVLPGAMPKILRGLTQQTAAPLIAGGLIRDKEDILGALSAGAAAVSATDPRVWAL